MLLCILFMRNNISLFGKWLVLVKRLFQTYLCELQWGWEQSAVGTVTCPCGHCYNFGTFAMIPSWHSWYHFLTTAEAAQQLGGRERSMFLSWQCTCNCCFTYWTQVRRTAHMCCLLSTHLRMTFTTTDIISILTAHLVSSKPYSMCSKWSFCL